MSKVIEAIIDLRNKLESSALAAAVKEDLKAKAQKSLETQIKNLRPRTGSNSLTDARVKVLKSEIDLVNSTKLTPTGLTVAISLKESTKDSTFYWADALNVGKVVVPKKAKWLAIPFSKQGYEITDYMQQNAGMNLVRRFVDEKVQTSKDGTPMLYYNRGASGHPIMSGKLKNGGWEPIATLLKEVRFPKTEWATNVLEIVKMATRV
jgi:hypothetical protein